VTQQLDLYDGPQLLYRAPQAEGAWLEMPFKVARKEPLRLLLNATQSYDFGRYQPFLNGVKLGEPLDFYSPQIVNTEFHLLDFWPEPGDYTLRLECVGRVRPRPGPRLAERPCAVPLTLRTEVGCGAVRLSCPTSVFGFIPLHAGFARTLLTGARRRGAAAD
jgi:hypothetical protein